ncbi:MAG: signal peptidase I [Oscillospiraceae bacterium]|nr:signal peptidase I [Oscillospiraceae bacterium]MBQ8012466.1 signal peptidase I [Oscillospiraceae bacterium]MBQ9110393.1 signal peptidase I [Oscillospiraceae bacterium]
MTEEKNTVQTERAVRDLPTTEQLDAELRRIRYRAKFIRTFRDTVNSLLVVAAIAVLICMLFLPVLRVTGTSMTPTMQNDELVICNKTGNFECGDIVAFHYNNKILLKRVIGVAGDWIDMREDGTVFVNGEQLVEPYVDDLAYGECDLDFPYQVPDNRIFVMGDHRSTSVDSRSSTVGCVADEYIIGRVFFRLWPWEKIGLI